MASRLEDRSGAILSATIQILDAEGYDAVQVRRVAAEASISLSTLYKLFGSRNELIVAALERWLADHAYVDVDVQPDLDVDDPPAAIAALIRKVFAPLERQPLMLAAIIRARAGPGGRRIDGQGIDLLVPAMRRILHAYDEAVVADLVLIAEHVNIGAVTRFADGEIDVTAIAPILERTIRRVLASNPPDGTPKNKHNTTGG